MITCYMGIERDKTTIRLSTSAE